MSKIFYLTTPLYYVNAKPHIGHAYTNILTDTFTRFHRLRGEKVHFLTGTDEHGTKIEKAAREKKLEPKAYVDEMVPQFQSLWEILDTRYDDFIRTTEERHKNVVAEVLRKLEKSGDIYKASYQGWYCTPCESFWTELQLDQGKCPDCKREVQKLSEENYFFKLSKYQTWLIDYIQSHDGFIQPEIRRNEILGFLKAPLEDLSITRPRSRLAWGIDYPGSKDHVVYVWFDALVNYISAAGCGGKDGRFESLWPADVHLVGKDILRQHAVYWPIMLKALGLEMPKMILAHGWWMMAGAKVSKSRGNAVDPVELTQKYGVDAFRYFLLREVTVGLDGTFSEDLLRERYTADLANDLGNLWFRVASMLGKYFGGVLPNVGARHAVPLLQQTFDLWNTVNHAMDEWDPREALASIFAVVTRANQYIEETKPWVLAKSVGARFPRPEATGGETPPLLADVMVTLAECLAHLAVILLPFLPRTSQQILERFHLDREWTLSNAGEFQKPFLSSGVSIEKGEILFPKLEEEAV